MIRQFCVAASLLGAGCDSRSSDIIENPTAAQARTTPAVTNKAPSETHAATELSKIAKEHSDPQYAQLLAAIVDDKGLVRYELHADPSHADLLQQCVQRFASTPTPTAHSARKAFWCNAYNVNVVAMALHESRVDGFKSVQDVPGFFDSMAITVGNEPMTLNGLAERIRQMGDPRIHAALNHAARSSPALRLEPYDANRIDEQLDDQCRGWLDDRFKNGIDRGRLVLNEVFKTYADDFKVDPYGGVVGFARKFSRPRGLIRDFIVSSPDQDAIRIGYLKYDWRLNQAPPEEAAVENEISDE